MISVKDLGWVAGFIEGEGSFHKGPALRASQVQKEPLEKLQALFGGSIHWRGNIWVWTICGKMAAGLMMTLYPMLSPRRKLQAKAQLDVWRVRRKNPANKLGDTCSLGHPYKFYTRRKRCLTCENLRRST